MTVRRKQADAEKVAQAKYALLVLHMALRALNDFERFWRPQGGRTWVNHYEELDDACALLRDAALAPMFANARNELLHVRAAMLVVAQLSRRTVGAIAGGSRSELFLNIARTWIVEGKAAILAAAPGAVP